jgi:hypothetical protein
MRSWFSSAYASLRKAITYECHAADCDKLLSLALPTDCFDIQADMFRFICNAGSQVCLQRHRFLEEMYTRICEENGPADPVLQGIVSTGVLLAESGGDLDRAERWASVAADNLLIRT